MAMNIDAMVNRFLAWPLPDSVRPDGTYPAGEYRNKVGHTLVGTNLLTADEARQMFEHCVAADPGAASELLTEIRDFLRQSVQIDGGYMDQNGNGEPPGYRSEWDQNADDYARELTKLIEAAPPAPVMEGAQREAVTDDVVWDILATAELVLFENPHDENSPETKLHYGMGVHDANGWRLMFHRESDEAAPPAPVTEGAQREAVAWRFVFPSMSKPSPWNDATEVTSDEWRDVEAIFSQNGGRIEYAYLAPPPPDRVQPERVEADSKRTITIACLRGITKHLRECPAYANLQGDADWIDEAADFIQNMLVEQYTASPPTDASGGVRVCHCTCHNDPLYCRECKECSCHAK